MFGERAFQQIVGISLDTNYAPLLIDLLTYSHETEDNQEKQ